MAHSECAYPSLSACDPEPIGACIVQQPGLDGAQIVGRLHEPVAKPDDGQRCGALCRRAALGEEPLYDRENARPGEDDTHDAHPANK